MKEVSKHFKITPAVIVIFGVTGDLSTRKLLPSLYELEKNSLLHEKTRVLGVSRREFDITTLLNTERERIEGEEGEVDEASMQKLSSRLELYSMDARERSGYGGLQKHLDEIEDETGLCMNRLYYLAVPPQVTTPIIEHLGEEGLNHGCTKHGSLSHLLLEKPFGFDTKTAEELIETTKKYFSEHQIFRIDHYLAKETVQNLVAFRFHNPIFENVWDRGSVQSIEIRADEAIDIEGRADFYEQVGALRDIIQSHLLHVMSVIMMDQPADITDGDEIHKMRRRVLEDMEVVPEQSVSERAIRGRYEGYTEEVENPDSDTETFVALKLYSRNVKWFGVPIYLRTGKALTKKETSITVTFNEKADDCNHANRLHFFIQPTEGIEVKLWAKKPGFSDTLEEVPMAFRYDEVFDGGDGPDAYERVLMDAIRGDNTLFATSEEVMASWKIIQPVLDTWKGNSNDMALYEKGSKGPSVEHLRNGEASA